jgi:hypothetical protein
MRICCWHNSEMDRGVVRDRAVRFVRLARKTGLAFPDLDLLLRSCCGGALDRAALRTVAALLAIGRGADLPIDVACSLVAPLDTAGLDGTGTTSTPFDRTDTSADLSLLHRVSRLVTPDVLTASRVQGPSPLPGQGVDQSGFWRDEFGIAALFPVGLELSRASIVAAITGDEAR